ncbi:hypothetical protein [Bifidobacterium sp.]|uniref:hypothetical protein n=1 Tax=Bifidobacterium sp. TaxID=41200 RepID=UPI002579B4D1|nr:hypothetical protein [Bifidobacterium sp.]MBS5401657.1 hypothetical protein [Bifidobacterium sp.]
MAKLFSFTMCETINNMQVMGNSVPMLIAPQIALRPQFVPGNFSFGLAVGVSEIDLRLQNQIKFVVCDPTGSEVYNSGETSLPIVANEDVLPREYQGFMMCVDIRNMTIPCEGAYVFSVDLNGEQIAKKMIPIYKKKI